MTFFDQVYAVARQIPYGKVTSYGAIARAIGAASSARMVGYAMNESPKAEADIPAHRVVNRNGLLTGRHHFPEPNTMQERLEAEGHKIIEHQIQQFHVVFWDPNTELDL